MKLRNILYIILMVVFISFAYLLFDRGLNAKTKIIKHVIGIMIFFILSPIKVYQKKIK